MAATKEAATARVQPALWLEQYLPALIVVAGLAARLIGAYSKFLNADEAMHYLLAMQPSLRDAYRASLGTAHPPLLIIFLHCWEQISSSEFFLRLPSVIAGTAAGWFLYLWLREVRDRSTAMIALALFLFSPALIYTSAEVRQYALLLCFMSAALCLLDRAIADDSPMLLLGSGIALYLAVLTHYCALIFGAALAIYGFLRIVSARPRLWLRLLWLVLQAGFAGIAAFLWKTHISTIRHRSLTQDVAQSYLRNSLFHPHQENMLAFFAKANLRLFHFLFSEGAVSVLGLVLFVLGIVLLFRRVRPAGLRRPSSRELAILLALPFALNCAAAIAGVYPYGGTRHNVYLAIFAMPAVAVAVAEWKPKWKWAKLVAVFIALAVCNFTVTPAGAYIKPKNQKKELMDEAVEYLRAAAPAGSLILTDYESGLLTSYYVCDKDITHAGEPVGFFYHSQCGDYESASLLPRLWVFRADGFPAQLSELAKSISRNQQVWIFQAGFIVDREPQFQALLAKYGCNAPRKFGANILVCRIEPPKS
ncbi:MAG TPA: glycosyltransferase family 39 protein [Terriglobales bacterium]|nr:glycosyltransferase family 39 protein [Terriglobales bacterium]